MKGTDQCRSNQPRAPLPYILYILSMLIFGTGGYVFSHISLAASQAVLFRTLLGGLLLTALVLIRGGFNRSAVRSDAISLLLGGSCLGANWIALFESFRLLNVSLATLIYYGGPMLVLLLSPVLFREKLSGQKIVSVCIVGVGLLCISGSIAAGKMSLPGLLTAVISAVFYASLIVCNKRVRHTGGMQTAAIELDIAFVVVLIYMLLTTGIPHPQPTDLPFIAVFGLVNTGLAYLLYFSGLQKLPGQTIALLSYIDPASALLFSALLLHEILTPLQVFGAVLIIGGAVYGELRWRPRRQKS